MAPKLNAVRASDKPRAGSLLEDAIYAGLFAGAVMAVAETVVSGIMLRGDWFFPWRCFASIILGRSALSGPSTLVTVLFGAAVHFALSVAFAVIWSGVVRNVPADVRHNYAAHTAAAMIYGLVLWIVNFQLVARVAYPWLLGTLEVAQLTIHAVGYGLPLGLLMTKRIAWMEPPSPVEGRKPL